MKCLDVDLINGEHARKEGLIAKEARGATAVNNLMCRSEEVK